MTAPYQERPSWILKVFIDCHQEMADVKIARNPLQRNGKV